MRPTTTVGYCLLVTLYLAASEERSGSERTQYNVNNANMCYTMTTTGKNAPGRRPRNENSRGLFDPCVCVNCWIPRKQRLFVQVVARQTNKHRNYIRTLLTNVSVVLLCFTTLTLRPLALERVFTSGSLFKSVIDLIRRVFQTDPATT